MLPRRLIPLAAVLALAAPVASGCGADPAGVADAASATAKKGTASYTMRIGMSGLGLPSKVDLRLSGVTSLSKPQMTMKADLGPLIAGFGVPIGSAPVDVRLDGRMLYVKPPAVPGLAMPGGKEWVAIDLAETVEAFGIDAAGLGALGTADPAAMLRWLEGSKGLEEIGEDTINGTETRHFRGTFTFADVVASLPAGDRARAAKALEQLEDNLGEEIAKPSPVDIWIDKDAVLRRMTSDQRLPASGGVPAGRFTLTYDLTKFGTKLDVARPASVADLTDGLVDGLKELSSLAAGGTLG
jgi:hypothetical protein